MKSGSKGSQIEESEVYEFGPYRLDAGERILLLDGRTVALTPKALDTLIVLVRNQPKVVSKEELLQAVWPGTFVEEGILAQNIMTLRKALQHPEWIETVPKRGYRFSHKVSAVAPEVPVSAPVRWRFPWWWPTTAAVLLMGAVAVVLAMRWERETANLESGRSAAAVN